MQTPAPAQTALTPPTVFWPWDTSMAARTDESRLGERIARLRRDQHALLRTIEAFISITA